jgi:hypothetical protein
MVTSNNSHKATKHVYPVVCPKCQGRALRADPTGSSDEQPRAPTNPKEPEYDLKVQIANLEKGLIDELCTGYHDSDEANKQIVRGEFRKFRIFRGWERA